MSRNRTIYNVEALYVGPAPDTGYHFIDYSGFFNNECTLNSYSVNLIKHLPRVQNVSYNIEAGRVNILELGKRSTIKRQIFDPPDIKLNFEYIQVGVLNELRLGFYCNYPRNYSPYFGIPYYEDTYNVCSINGFIIRTDEKEQNEIRWPYLYRDKRNLFVAVNQNQLDLKTGNTYYEIDSNAKNWGVYAFGGCYITNYSTSASVGDFPRVNVSYTADNLKFYSSGSGVDIPAVNTKTYSGISGVKFALPSPVDGTLLPSCLLPGDITLDIYSKSQRTGIPALQGGLYLDIEPSQDSFISNFGSDFSDLKIQSYTIDLSLERRSLKSFGYKLSTDKIITFPLFINTSFTALVGDIGTGSIENLIKQDKDYFISINLKNPLNKGEVSKGIAVKYDFKKSKFVSINYDAGIGRNKSVTFNYVTEIDPDDLSKGFFISGLLNTDITGISQLPYDEWVTELGENVVTETSENIVVGSYVVFY